MQSRVINRMFVLLTVEKRASPLYYKCRQTAGRELNFKHFKKDFFYIILKKAILIYSFISLRLCSDIIVTIIMLNCYFENASSNNRIDIVFVCID